MLSSYLEPVRTGFAAFVGVGALVLLPLVALHYYRFGRVEPRRALVLYGLLAYGLVAMAVIFLPFPSALECTGEDMLSTTPFQWVTDMRNNLSATGRSGVEAVVTSTVFLQQALNVALFVPLGVVLRKSYGRGPFTVIAVGLGISLAVEVVQYTGNLGAFPCPYRIADVDDLISNTAGSLLGWMIAPVALVVPTVPHPDASTAPPDTVTVPRRLLGLAMDVTALIVLTHLVFRDNPWWLLALTFTIRVVLPSSTGRTPGGWLLHYGLRRADGTRANPLRITLRELLGVTGLITYTALAPSSWWFALDLAVLAVFVLGAFALPVFRRDQRGLPDLAAGTRAVPTADHSRTTPLAPVP
ncbi:glycopeptide antibiotics resistance protein [Saccharothrix saharensis]|uniref:Glycopeptide antibiotics resistance protein n=1 Tax=Saccharothrix saharensis TaxID=571190 RepID=A0A543JIS4_9PSEU|nr:VanZ family protein [Saccharothrix saharensis]TQM82770.1 glycopeptide antibiotics resistance protein [Saccharothrix saharensis]